MKKPNGHRSGDLRYLSLSVVCWKLDLNNLARAIRKVRSQVFF